MNKYSWVALCQGCNRIVGAIASDHKERLKMVGEWVEDGCTVTRMDNETIRAAAWGCKCPASEGDDPVQLDLFGEVE